MISMIKLTAALCGLALTASIVDCAQTRTSESTGAYVDDTAITSKVKTAILADPALKLLDIHVVTYNDVVQLSGFVDNSRTVAHAGDVANSVNGVKSVQNELAVK
jgi:osmotically-inducible protein OsmY